MAAKEKVTWVASRYRGGKIHMSFYTKSGKKVPPEAVERVPGKKQVLFQMK